MWCSDRRRLLGGLAALAGAGALAGCFRPMLAEDGAAAELRGRIALPAGDDRFAWHLRESLARGLGEPGPAPDFRLEVKTRLEERNLAVTRDRAVTRVSLAAFADWRLYPQGGEAPVLAGTAESHSGYNSTASIFATRSVRLDVERRLARDLGERITRAILARATFARAPGAAPGAVGPAS